MQPTTRLVLTVLQQTVLGLALPAAATLLAGCSDSAGAERDGRTSSALQGDPIVAVDPIVAIDRGLVRGVAIPGGFAFRGLPYAAPPTGNLRWRAPRSPQAWDGIRDASAFAPSCPQVPPTFTKGPTDEDCLYLNVYTPQLVHRAERGRPVLVWIHGGGFTSGAGRDYDPGKLAAEGTVVVTINYRLAGLGFLSHPALASQPGGPSGNYGLMDQQASLRWVRDNISQFGGDPDNVTIAGESAGGLAVLMHLVSRGARGLFHRAVVESGSFAPTQLSLAAAEAAGEGAASDAGCNDHQIATCLRNLSVADVMKNFSGTVIPGTVDGMVLSESIGTALAGRRFARVPILDFAFSALVGDANFACTALQQDNWTSPVTRTFAYEFNDDAAPAREAPFPGATHTSELAYIFDLPDAPYQTPFSADQERLAATMRAAWASFAANGTRRPLPCTGLGSTTRT